MRRLYWIILLIALGILWGCYTWVDWVRAAIDNALAPVFAFLGSALSGTYTTIVTSPFWQTWIVPYQFFIGLAVMGLIWFLSWRLHPVQRVKGLSSKAQVVRQSSPEYTAPQVIPESPKQTIPPPQSVVEQKEEVTAE